MCLIVHSSAAIRPDFFFLRPFALMKPNESYRTHPVTGAFHQKIRVWEQMVTFSPEETFEWHPFETLNAARLFKTTFRHKQLAELRPRTRIPIRRLLAAVRSARDPGLGSQGSVTFQFHPYQTKL